MPWQQTLSLTHDFEEVFTRLSNRVETANNRKEPLGWRNYRQWYQKLVRDTKRSLRALKRHVSNDNGLLTIIDNLASSLTNVFDIDSETSVKWSEINVAKQIWQQFRNELEKKIKQEFDLFPQRSFVIDQKLCFVLMPFNPSFDSVYNKAIRPAVTKSKMKAKRADEIFRPTSIVQDIWEYINRASLIIADVTDRNPNVFYEVGLGHAIPKRLIILTQKKEDVPFDIQHIRWIRYDNTTRGLRELRTKLRKTIKSVLA